MKSKILLLFVFLSMFSCKNTENQEQKNWTKISTKIEYHHSNDFFELKSGKNTYKIPQNRLPFKRIILLNASLLGYFTEIGKENTIVGISSPEYIFSSKVKQQIQNKTTETVGDEAKYDVEKILSLKPDAVFTNYIESFQNTYDLLKKNGIEVIFIDEYLEQKPLEKSRIIEVFGQLLGATKEAENAYESIKNRYEHLKHIAQKAKEKPIVIANEMYGNQWFMPGGRTFVAELLNDANAQYILKENTEDKAVPLTFEEVYVKANKAQFWVNIGNYPNKKALLQINPNYNKLNVYQNGRLYAITEKQIERTNDYFESGVVRADKVLQDYIKIFHPDLLPNVPMTYLKELR
ncbi:MAG: ABC transporter substrate-binding protein [Bacteroidetes bacterium]|nr:ABC transporter substrate-binding protein [Bacteroidota bacterium]